MTRFLFPAILAGSLVLSSCSQSPQKMVETGNKYHDQKKYKEASILYRKALTKDKANAEAYYREGINLMDQAPLAGGREAASRLIVEAAGFFRKAVDLDPKNTDAAVRAAEVYIGIYMSDKNRFKALLPDVEELKYIILKNDPNSYAGARLQGIIFLGKPDNAKALEWLEKADKMKPFSRDMYSPMMALYTGEQKLDQAEKYSQDFIAHDKTFPTPYAFLEAIYTKEDQKDKKEALLEERLQNLPGPESIERLAAFYALSGRVPEGEAVVRKTLEDPKTYPDGRLLTGGYYAGMRQYDKALVEFQAGAKEHPDRELVYVEKEIGTLVLLKRMDEAMNMAKELYHKYPKDNRAGELYAATLLDSGLKTHVNESVAELQQLVASNSKNPQLHYLLARAYFEQSRLDPKALDKALAEAEESIHLTKSMTDLKPGEAQALVGAHMVAGRIYEDRGNHAKAIEHADLMLSRQPGNLDGRLIKDRALLGISDIDRAISDLEDLVEKAPAFADAHAYLAGAYLAKRDIAKANEQYIKLDELHDRRGFLGKQTILMTQGKSDEAIKNLQQAVSANPKDLDALFALANFQASSNKLPDAIANYQKILKTGANSEDLWLRLGVCQRILHQNDAALASFEQAQGAAPTSSRGLLERALLLDNIGRRSEAKDVYNKVLGIDPENVIALNNLAFLLADSNTDLDQALSYAERAKKKAPKSADISDTLGFVYYQKNLNREALQELRTASEANPGNSSIHFHLAMALLKSGDRTGAKAEADKALQHASPDELNKIKTFMGGIG
jgi:tetratricopeptide (TPR) repeat protein